MSTAQTSFAFLFHSPSMASNIHSPKVSVELLIDQETNSVILAQVGHDFIDTLRSLLTFPLGNITRLAAKHKSLQPGCLNNLYNSVENLGLNNFRTNACKHMLLYPRSVHEGKFTDLKLNMHVLSTEPTKYFLCQSWPLSCKNKPYGFLSFNKYTRCTCGSSMSQEIDSSEVQRDAVKGETEGVLHKQNSKFYITDDLRLSQGLPGGGLVNFLVNLGIKNVNRIEEKVVKIGSQEMTNLLIHSLVSKTTLTDVFLRKEGILSRTLAPDEQFIPRIPIEKEEATENEGKTSVNITLRKSDKKVLYAEASDDFLDLLFSFLTIPLESVLELLGGKVNLTVGSVSNLRKGLDTIFSNTKEKSFDKGVLLPAFYSCPNEFPDIGSMDPPNYYWYSKKSRKKNIYYYLTSNRERGQGQPLKRFDPKSPEPTTTNSSGYVKKDSLFVVTNNLVVKSLSSVFGISLLKETGIPLEDVEQQVVTIGEVEALVLLRACLCSTSALSALLNVYVKQPKQEPL